MGQQQSADNAAVNAAITILESVGSIMTNQAKIYEAITSGALKAINETGYIASLLIIFYASAYGIWGITALGRDIRKIYTQKMREQGLA